MNWWKCGLDRNRVTPWANLGNTFVELGSGGYGKEDKYDRTRTLESGESQIIKLEEDFEHMANISMTMGWPKVRKVRVEEKKTSEGDYDIKYIHEDRSSVYGRRILLRSLWIMILFRFRTMWRPWLKWNSVNRNRFVSFPPEDPKMTNGSRLWFFNFCSF